MKKSKFEISKGYTIWWKIRVCYKDSIPFVWDFTCPQVRIIGHKESMFTIEIEDWREVT